MDLDLLSTEIEFLMDFSMTFLFDEDESILGFDDDGFASVAIVYFAVKLVLFPPGKACLNLISIRIEKFHFVNFATLKIGFCRRVSAQSRAFSRRVFSPNQFCSSNTYLE